MLFLSRLLCFVTICCSGFDALADEPPIVDVAFAPNGKSVITVSQSGLSIYSWPGLKRNRTVKTSFANCHCVAFDRDGKTLAVGGGDPAENGAIAIFSWPDCQLLRTIKPHKDLVLDVTPAGNDQWISASLDRDVRVVASDAKSEKLSGHSRGVTSVCTLQEGTIAVSAGLDNSLRVWNLESGKLVRSLSQHTKPVSTLAMHPGNEGLPMVASASEDRTIRFWQPTIGRMVRYIRLDSAPLDIAWLNDGELIVAACTDGKIRIIDATNVTLLSEIDAIDGWAYSVAVHPTDGSILVAGERGQLKRLLVAAGNGK